MKSNNSIYELEATLYDKALDILEDEQHKNKSSNFQRWVYILLRLATYGLFGTGVLLIPIALVLGNDSPLFNIVLYGLILCVAIIPILVIANLPFMFKLRRQARLLKKLGLSKSFKSSWRYERKKKRLYNFIDTIVLAIGIIILILLFVFSVIGVEESFEWGAPDIYELLGLFLGVLIVSLYGVAFISVYTVRKAKNRLKVVSDLISNLRSYRSVAEETGDNQIDIPSTEYEMIADIERAQISQDRQQVIIGYMNNPEIPDYIVQKSKLVRERISKLELATKLLVKDAIERLSDEPKPVEAKEDPESNTWNLRLSEIPVDITYEVDDINRRVKVYALHLQDDDSQSNPEPGE